MTEDETEQPGSEPNAELGPEPTPPAVAEPVPQPEPEPERGKRGGLGCLIELVETLVLTLVIFFVIQNFVAQPFRVEQHSMERTFEEGQYVLVDRLSHLWSPYARGQVVVFHDAGYPEPLIKRVIGVGGDTVEIHDGQVFINGTALLEPYLYRNDAGQIEPTVANDLARWVVPEGDIFVMGDHRQVSADSRVLGPVPISSVVGRAVLRYWPLSVLSLVDTPSYAP